MISHRVRAAKDDTWSRRGAAETVEGIRQRITERVLAHRAGRDAVATTSILKCDLESTKTCLVTVLGAVSRAVVFEHNHADLRRRKRLLVHDYRNCHSAWRNSCSANSVADELFCIV